MQHVLGDLVVGIERAAVEPGGPEAPPRAVHLVEHERRRAQRHHLVKPGPAAQRLRECHREVIARQPLQVLEQVLRIRGLTEVLERVDTRSLFDHGDLEPGLCEAQRGRRRAEAGPNDQDVRVDAGHGAAYAQLPLSVSG